MKKLIFAAVFVLAGFLGVHFWFSSRKLNVILISIDTFRRDHSTCYNPSAPPTPAIDEIAANGVLFQNAFTLVPTTLPAHSSMLASFPPHEMGVFNNGDIFGDKLPLLQEILQKNGYQTGAFVSMGVLKKVFGLGRGFATYEDDFSNVERFYKNASEMNELALPWIRKHAQQRFFLFLHYSDPHEPYLPVDAPPDMELRINDEPAGQFCISHKQTNTVNFEAKPGVNKIDFVALDGAGVNGRLTEAFHVVVRPRHLDLSYGDGWVDSKRQKIGKKYFIQRGTITFENKEANPVQAELRFAGRGKIFQSLKLIKNNYRAEVQFTDRHIGELWNELQKLNIREKTMIILTSDHGEAFGEHGRVGHGFPLYKENLEVPFIIYYPGLGRKGERSIEFANHLDIMPTVLDVLRIRHDGEMKGRSLKADLSRSPIDRLFAKSRAQTFFYTYAPAGRANSYSVLRDRLKLIQTRADQEWNWEAYDLGKDPGEKQNLFETNAPATQSAEFSALRGLLNEQKEESERAFGHHKNPTLDEEQKEMLRDLGYIAQ